MGKFDGLPSWNLISLRESVDRRKVMVDQFEKYGVSNYRFYQTDRWVNIQQHSHVVAHHHWSNGTHGTSVSHLNSLRDWYLTTDEPYAIFSDDDVDLSTCEYWNFNFAEFVDALPEGWECVQLLRKWIETSVIGKDAPDAKLNMFYGRWFGVQALMSRAYVKKVLDRHITGWNSYNLRVVDTAEYNGDPNTISYVENVLFMCNGLVYNFPLFVELENRSTVYNELSGQSRELFDQSREVFLTLWKEHRNDLSIKDRLSKVLWVS